MMYTIIGTIIVGAIAGLIAGLLRRGTGFGVFWSMVIGVVGGGIGSVIFSLFGMNRADSNLYGNIFVSVIGSLVLLSIININS
jgi:uncharacterized membrane protein YeaQ/YmgE (transglycosylase-associated protein family)